MTTRYERNRNPRWLLAGSPGDFQVENFDRILCNGDLTALATGVMRSVAIPFEAGDVVTNLTFKSGATAADTPLNWWFALYSMASTPALLAQTADQTTTAWAANTVMTKALATPQTIPTTGVYYAAIMMKATTPCTLLGRDVGIAGASASILSSKILAQTSGSTLTDTAPATVATPTTSDLIPLVIAT